MRRKLAGLALPAPKQAPPVENRGSNGVAKRPAPLTPLQKEAIRLYARGKTLSQVATILDRKLVPNRIGDLRRRRRKAKAKLQRWEQQQAFRDELWAKSIARLDMASGRILEGMADRAAGGRVDAARLAFELTGRHNPKGEQEGGPVQIFIADLPRPRRVDADIEVEPEPDSHTREMEG